MPCYPNLFIPQVPFTSSIASNNKGCVSFTVATSSCLFIEQIIHLSRYLSQSLNLYQLVTLKAAGIRNESLP